MGGMTRLGLGGGVGRAGYAAAGWAFLFAVPHVFWAIGGRAGLRWSLALRGPDEEALIRDPAFVAQGLWGVAGLCVVAGLIGLATVRPWGARVPRRLLRAATWGVCAVLLLRALFYPGFLFSGLKALGLVGHSARADPGWTTWDLLLWSPWFLLGAVLFGAAARSAPRRP